VLKTLIIVHPFSRKQGLPFIIVYEFYAVSIQNLNQTRAFDHLAGTKTHEIAFYYGEIAKAVIPKRGQESIQKPRGGVGPWINLVEIPVYLNESSTTSIHTGQVVGLD